MVLDPPSYFDEVRGTGLVSMEMIMREKDVTARYQVYKLMSLCKRLGLQCASVDGSAKPSEIRKRRLGIPALPDREETSSGILNKKRPSNE